MSDPDASLSACSRARGGYSSGSPINSVRGGGAKSCLDENTHPLSLFNGVR